MAAYSQVQAKGVALAKRARRARPADADLGLHAGYNAMFPRDDGSALKFVTLGAHAAIVL